MPTDYRTAHLTIEEKDRREDAEAALRDYWDDREAELDEETDPMTAEIVHPESPCATPGCPNTTIVLTVFPGGICLDCYRPQGEVLHRTMTATTLARMWGGR